MQSRTKQKILERLPYGRLEQHILDTLALFEAATNETLVEYLPRQLKRPNSLTAVKYQTGKLCNYNKLVRVFPNAFVLRGSTVTWRTLLKITKPDLDNIVWALGARTVLFDDLCARLRTDCDMTAKQVGDGLRKLKSLNLVEKQGKSHWRVAHKLDHPCLAR